MSSLKKASRPAKRRRAEFGQHTEDDDLSAAQSQAAQPSASAWSTRKVHTTGHVQSLASFCIQVFVRHFKRLAARSDDDDWEELKGRLALMPEAYVPRIFAALRSACPTVLGNKEMTYFMRGTSVVLTEDLPGVNRDTLGMIGQGPYRRTLLELHVTGQTRIADSVFASTVSKLTVLKVLNLRGCTKAGAKTVAAAATSCPNLTSLNLNYTSTTPVSLAPLLRNCTSLEVLKLAGIPNWTEATVSKLWAELKLTELADFHLPESRFKNLKNLKLRQTAVTDTAVNRWLLLCPNIRRLDLSFTAVQHPAVLLNAESLAIEKLSLTSTRISVTNLLQMLTHMPELKTLAIGALGANRGLTAAIANTTAMTLSDVGLHDITDILAECKHLENVNLVGNSKLGMASRKGVVLSDFISRVGRRCKSLNMAGITYFTSACLEGLQPQGDEGPSRLQTLVLNNTHIDDEATPFLSSCPDMRVLELANTKVTSAGLFPLIDACPKLEQLNLTSCRGIGVVDRRKFFEVWEEEWKDQ
ncbi:hypothetical protein EIP91_004689 [Steccherinum ochraceum]|uniref:RNI-like protein n=1 Tax=Steccherinum ochraceum TaxID=92696 RepID=A0A4V2MVV8_9APHY|nr:hypothetical protein EIP91_004689 [Steccherinum ochraceum]